ncbi:MAG: bifunctional glycogen debranching protein GlgX/4-alpha-glucanotransferase [Veillonellales bacterium]
MWQNQVVHNSQLLAYRSPFGAVSCREKITFRLKVPSDAGVEDVELRTWLDGTGEEKFVMKPVKQNEGDLFYQAVVTAPASPSVWWYYFLLSKDGKICYYGNSPDGLGGAGQVYDREPPSYQVTVHQPDSVTPNWLKEAVIYQIMPDRFYNGEPEGKILQPKQGSVIHPCWEDTPYYTRDTATGEIVAYDFFGGNLRGILAKLPYLQQLGITALYLNPIFEAVSNHRYDTGDYHQIDAMLGDNDLFAELCAKAAEKGIAVILDGVFSHTGRQSRYFNGNGTYPDTGACQSKESPYYSWYRFRHWPDDYECWWGIDDLPNVEETEPSYREFIISGGGSVLKYWLSQGIKGWRLDVADELPESFIREFAKTLKEEDPDAVLIGEVWEDASHKVSYGGMRHYLGGGELDSVMNYPFREIALKFLLGEQDGAATARALFSLYENYPKQNFYAMMNLIGSHDVPRILTLLGEAPSPESLTGGQQARYRLPADRRQLAVARLKLLVLWQMTFPGVPSVYYGDEAGLEGYKDPLNRGTYPWGREDQEILAWHQQLIRLRHQQDALKTGEWLNVYAQGDSYGYLRRIVNGRDVFGQQKQDGMFLILLNRSRNQSVTVTVDLAQWCRGILRDVLQEGREYPIKDGKLILTLQPLEGKLLTQPDQPALKRGCGILLHPTALPSKYGIGDLGKEAYEFINFLAESKQKLWQILPLNPVGYGESPYQCLSAFAGNPLLISLGKLVRGGLLPASEVRGRLDFDPDRVEFDRVWDYKERRLRLAYENFQAADKPGGYRSFMNANSSWLEDYALFMALKTYFQGAAWNCWPEEIAFRRPEAMAKYRKLLAAEIDYHKFLQYIFFRQWASLKGYAHQWGIQIIGDLPLFISQDSSDVWANPGLFALDEAGCCAKKAGVPPDYFCTAGQLWGNPQYRWEEMVKDDYQWWRERVSLLLRQVDIIRIDHFRGFEAYWEIPGSEKTAVHGTWVQGPGEKFFATLGKYLGKLPVIAENLGVITPAVEDLKQQFNFPGMKVLQFSFSQDEQGSCRPFACTRNTVVYTGTHDNDTTVGWYQQLLADQPELARCIGEMLGLSEQESLNETAVCRQLVEFAYQSNGNTVMIPMQDILQLDSQARMNLPGTVGGNWRWRCPKNRFTPEVVTWLADLAQRYKR